MGLTLEACKLNYTAIASVECHPHRLQHCLYLPCVCLRTTIAKLSLVLLASESRYEGMVTSYVDSGRQEPDAGANSAGRRSRSSSRRVSGAVGRPRVPGCG